MSAKAVELLFSRNLTGADKTRNTEQTGVPVHSITIIIMRKIYKLKFSKNKLNKSKSVSARNMKIYFGRRGVGSWQPVPSVQLVGAQRGKQRAKK